MISLQQVKDYLRIDYEDDYLNDLIDVSLVYIDSMVGENYKVDEKAVRLSELLQLKLISDMYEQRTTEIANNIKLDRITSSILDKLSNLEMSIID